MGEINGTPNIFKLEVLSSTYTGTPATEITLVDTSINTSSPKYSVGIYGDFNPTAADVPIGSFSHTCGESTHTVGNGSSAKGTSTEALGYYSHAEGSGTQAIGIASHAEGVDTTSTGGASHAEGETTTATGLASHAEGFSTKASGSYSHAEGRGTTSTGLASHAEGRDTNTVGPYSHAEGFSTVASGSYQHVQGQYNISSSADSAFIVGNGTADNSRSNLIFASGSQVQITGSLIVSGSGTFTNIGPAVFSGSVASTAGFTGSLQGTASFALAVAGGGGGGASIYRLTSQTLTSGSWTATGSYYTSSFANANITSTTRVDFIPNNDSYTEVTTAGILPQVTTTTGTASFYSLFPPQTNIIGEITIFPTV